VVEGEKYNVVIVVGGADSKHKVPLKNKYKVNTYVAVTFFIFFMLLMFLCDSVSSYVL